MNQHSIIVTSLNGQPLVIPCFIEHPDISRGSFKVYKAILEKGTEFVVGDEIGWLDADSNFIPQLRVTEIHELRNSKGDWSTSIYKEPLFARFNAEKIITQKNLAQ